MLHVVGNLKANGTLTLGGTIIVDGTAGSEKIASSNSIEVHVANGRALRLETNGTSPNVIGGFSGNSVTAGTVGATIGGGGFLFNPNSVSDDHGTIGGGANNRAGDGTTSVRRYATVGGGFANTASGYGSTVAGGGFNQAGGTFSFAGGLQAIVRDDAATADDDGDEGTFIWADATFADFTSTGPHQFLVRAAGGVGINRNNPDHPLHIGTDTFNGNGAHVTAGGVWTNGSDRNSKQNFEEIDKQEVLRKVAELPVTRWQYKGEAERVRHIGPVAQDFYAAFGTGGDDRYIGTVDADGVALAAIQGLHGVLQEKDCEIDELRERNEDMADRNEQLEARLAALEAAVSKLLIQETGE